ncbi:MAG: PSD1 and planctomycete cytochrome C domain-containing protein [Prosthecobacter sp.]
MTATLLPRLFLISTLLASAGRAAPSPEALKFFESKIRPILVESCHECHADKKHKGELRVDNLPYLIQGGHTGPAVVPHQPDKSLLMKAISYTDPDMEMPPDGKLSDAQIAALKQWILMGAPWPEAEVAAFKPARKPGDMTPEDKKWWSFLPVKNSPVPKAAPGTAPIDAFIQTELNKNGLAASKEASPQELIRRITFDLHGLPPKPEDEAQFVKEFSAAKSQDASDKIPTSQTRADQVLSVWVDKLLASPRYGERWAQHWLDLTRYAESEGYRLDSYRPNVWPYRDYVIDSLNNDKPYDQFVREQIAGDEIAPNDPKKTIATAFLRHTIYEYNQRDSESQWRGITNEVTDVTADVFMGMSVQCAQCHDHKFDPILQKDYYRLQSFLANITWPEDKVLATEAEKATHAAQMKIWLDATTEPRAVIDGIIEPKVASAQKNAMEKFPEEVQVMWRKTREQRTPYEEQIVQLAWRQAEYERYRLKTDKLKEPQATQLKEAQAKLAEFDHLKPKPLLTAFVIGETGPQSRDAKYKSRKTGDAEAKPGFLTILDPSDAIIPEPKPGMTTSGRRTVLANWLTRPENPLTTRVIVNRIWQYHFGRGIVATPSDFGHLGEKPTHPELLDWLTTQFVQGGWKMKPMHKMIVMSQVYRQTARRESSTKELVTDPENKLLWRFPPRRLDAEQARDAVLAASGELDTTMGGEGVEAAKPRRSIYTRKIRNTPDDFLQSLDAPSGFASMPTRDATTTATQSLLMINGDWPLERSRAMAARLVASKPTSDAQIIDQAYDLTFSRNPTATEKKAAIAFLNTQRSRLKKELPPPAPEVPAIADAQKFFGPAVSKTTKTLWMEPGSKNEKLRVQKPLQVEGNQFAIEAVVTLSSLYPNGSVRTIASRWDNDKAQRGWALGVTSEKSAYKPNNLILQLSGEDFQGSLAYEVVASDLRIPLNKPYYVAAAINNVPGEGQKFGGTVTFYTRDLSDPAAPMQNITVPHQIVGSYVNAERALYVGGREKDKASLWHGAIARVSIRQGNLDAGKLMTWAGATDASCVVDVNADNATEMLKTAWTWESSAAPATPKGKSDPNREAIADLCHVLLNANEFFYLH